MALWIFIILLNQAMENKEKMEMDDDEKTGILPKCDFQAVF